MNVRSNPAYFAIGLVSCFGLVTGGCQAPADRAGIAVSQPGDQGDYDPKKAFRSLSQIEGDPQFPVVATTQPAEVPAQAVRRIMAGKALYRENRLAEAILELEGALRYVPQSFEVNQLLAIVCRKAENHGRAISHLRKAVEIKTDDVICRYMLGVYAKQEKKNAEALTEFRLAMKCPNASEDSGYRALTEFHLAEVLRDEGYLTAAAEAYAAFVNLTAKPQPTQEANAELAELVRLKRGYAARQTAFLYERMGLTEKAITSLAAVVGQFPDDGELQSTYARLLSRVGNHDEAIRLSQEILAARPSARQSMELLLEVHEAAGKIEQAVDALRALRNQRPEDADLGLALVEVLLRKGRTTDAQSVLRDLIARHPEATDLHWRLVEFYEGQSQWVDAVVHAGELIQADPTQRPRIAELVARLANHKDAMEMVEARCGGLLADHPTSHGLPYVAGLLAAAAGDINRALQMQQECVRRRPDFVPGLIALGETCLRRYAWSEAIEAARKALADGFKDASFQRILGEAFDGLDAMDEAAGHYAEAIRLDPQDVASMMKLAELYERSDQKNRAMRQYGNILSLNPGVHEAREALLRIHVGENDLEKAKSLLDWFEKMGSDTPAYARCKQLMQYQIGRMKAQLKPTAGAAEKLASEYAQGVVEIAREFPEDVESQYHAAAACFNSKEYGEALEWCNRTLELDSYHIEARELLTHVYRTQLRYSEAREVLEGLLTQYPNRRSWRVSLAEQHLIEQTFDQAVDILDKLLKEEKDPSSRGAQAYQLNLIDALQLAGRTREALDRIDQWIARDAKTVNHRIVRLLVSYWAGQTREAAAFAKAWFQKDPNNIQARLNLFEALLRDERPWEAIRTAMEWLAKDPENKAPDYARLLIEGLSSAGESDDAIELAMNRAAIPDQRVDCLEQLASVYRAAGLHDKRVEVLQRLAREQREGGEQELRQQDALAVAQALISAKRFREAEQQLTLRSGEEQSPSARRLSLQLLSFCYLQQHKTRLAVKVLEDVLEASPKDPGACNDLGYTLADAGLDLDRAEGLTRFAVGEEPRSNAYLDSLGWVLYKKGDFAGAKQWLTKAVRARSILGGSLESVEDPVLYDHLGDALWRLGEKEQAQAAWKKAIRSGDGYLRRRAERDDSEVLENTRKKIEATKRNEAPPVAPYQQRNAA